MKHNQKNIFFERRGQSTKAKAYNSQHSYVVTHTNPLQYQSFTQAKYNSKGCAVLGWGYRVKDSRINPLWARNWPRYKVASTEALVLLAPLRATRVNRGKHSIYLTHNQAGVE